MLVHNYLEKWATCSPANIALATRGVEYTYDYLNQNSDRLATWLLDHNIKHQDRVLIFMENSIEAVLSLFGILKAGAVFIMPNPTMKANKLKYILKNSDSRVLISHKNKLRVVKDAIRGLPMLESVIIVNEGNSLHDNFNLDDQLTPLLVRNWSNIEDYPIEGKNRTTRRTIDVDLASIIYTSGSTGNPKGVMSAHKNMVSAIRSITEYLQNNYQDIILSCLPLSFDYGLYQILMGIKFGGKVILEENFVFPYKVLAQIPNYKVTGFPIVPSMLALIFQLKKLDQFDFSSLRYISNTAAALPHKYIKRVKETWPHIDIYSMYGLTECKRVSYLPPDTIESYPGSVGIPMPNTDIILVSENGKEVRPGEIGELVIRGSNIMQGYWKLPEETEKTFRRGKYRDDVHLYTGDYFKVDNDGHLYFVGRKDDLIKTKGERVSPREIENTINEIEGIIEVAVVGYPDEIDGQSIRVHVITNNTNLTERDILRHCKINLEPFMIPKIVKIEQFLPKNNNGKIDKKKLIRHNIQCRRIMHRRNNKFDNALLEHINVAERRHLSCRRSLTDRRYT